MKKFRASQRGLTFSIEAGEQYYPGSHYVYEVRRNCIIIRPSSDTGDMTVSKKKSGHRIKALFDIRQKDVRRAVSTCDYLEMEIKEDRIVVRCIREIRSKIISLDEVLREFCITQTELSMAAGMDQITIEQYLSSLSLNTQDNETEIQLKSDIEQVFSVMSLFSGAGMLDWPFYRDPQFEILFACDFDREACESYRHNIGDHIICGDVREVHGYVKPCNLIIGGPSCKPFSASNRRKRVEQHQDVDLVNEYIRITQENAPEVFVIENVPQFISCNEGMYLDRVMRSLGNKYSITATLVKDADVGGFTLRKRAILIGSRIGTIKIPNAIIHPIRTVKDALKKVNATWFNYSDLTVSKPDTVQNIISEIFHSLRITPRCIRIDITD